jgi:nucleoid DNA-binding protein
MSNIVTPAKLADRLQEKLDLDKETLNEFSSELFSILVRELKKEDHFSIFGFGNFKRVHKEERMGRNPKTGEEITIPAHYRIKFTPAGKIADRINSEYAHLKPVILEEDLVHEGLLLKAERYIISIPAEPEPEQPLPIEELVFNKPCAEPEKPCLTGGSEVKEKEPESDQPLPIEELAFKEPDFGFKKDRRFKLMIAVFIAMIILMIIFGTSWFILKGKTKSKSISEAPSSMTTTKEQESLQPETVLPRIISDEAVIQESFTETPPVSPELPGTSYKIAPGDSFSLLAQRSWGNIYLWPFIYSKNRENYPDPDLIRPGDSILIPTQPDAEKDQFYIEDSILMAYKRYRELIQEQAGNPRNSRRNLSAGYVILGGERLYPGFLNKNRGSIRIEDIRKAEDQTP